MAETLTFDNLIRLLHHLLEQTPDHRTGKNTKYTIKDAGLAAFAVFFVQSPSFLAHQRQMKRIRGKDNAESLFRVKHIPCDNQIRNLLDPVGPDQLFPLFRTIYDALELSEQLDAFRFPLDNLLISLDGTRYFSSQKIHCQNCSRSTTEDEVTTYFHDIIIPVLVAPGNQRIITLEPEFIMPQDGHDKQDCEQAAGKRWIRRNAGRFAPRKATVLGDALYSKQPFCELLLEKKFNFILVCKPDSHTTLYEWIDFTGTEDLVVRHWNGRFGEIHTYRYVQHVPLRRGDDALFVDWCELTITQETTGKILYRNAFVTNYSVTEDNVAVIVKAGRARWKSENESHNVLKTKGYHLEHNFGHGKENLASVLLTLNLLAFLFHPVLSMVSATYQLLRKELATRRTFFNDIRALTRYLYFTGWEDMLEFMIAQLELSPDEIDSS